MPLVEPFSLAQARRVAVMLGLDPMEFHEGTPVPRGWHFAMLAGQTPRADLRSDGFPGLGVPMPQLGLPRLLLGGRSTTFRGDLRIGAPLHRHSAIAGIEEKSGRNGAFAIVRVEHSLTMGSGLPEVSETQTYMLAGPAAPAAAKAPPSDLPPGFARIVTPDDLLLFQYSALGFNTHRIHFDRDHARFEGHPDLVVNGGLATLLATEVLRRDLGQQICTMNARHLAPLYVNRPMTILFPEQAEPLRKVLILDAEGVIAAELVITLEQL